MKRIFSIVLPSLIPSGPVKGAIALANQLIHRGQVFLVVLKPGTAASAHIDERIQVIHLWHFASGYLAKIAAYRRFLKHFDRTGYLFSISFCFSADFVNSFCRKYALTCVSVRGNLPINYQMDYGFSGLFLAYFHLFMLRRFDIVFTMTAEMSTQV